MEQTNPAYKGHKPANNHLWKRTRILNSEKGAWINENSTYAYANSWKVGGGKRQK